MKEIRFEVICCGLCSVCRYKLECSHYIGCYEQNEWRETWFENICEKISGHNSGWIAAFIALRFMLVDWEDDNEIEIIDELFNRNKISDPYSFYTAVYCSDMDYRYFQTSEELAKDAVHEDIDLGSWIAEYVDWDGVINELLYETYSTWYYNKESCVAIELSDIDVYRYPKKELLRHYNIIMGEAELLTLEEFEQLNKPPLEPITLEEIMTFLGGVMLHEAILKFYQPRVG